MCQSAAIAPCGLGQNRIRLQSLGLDRLEYTKYLRVYNDRAQSNLKGYHNIFCEEIIARLITGLFFRKSVQFTTKAFVAEID